MPFTMLMETTVVVDCSRRQHWRSCRRQDNLIQSIIWCMMHWLCNGRLQYPLWRWGSQCFSCLFNLFTLDLSLSFWSYMRITAHQAGYIKVLYALCNHSNPWVCLFVRLDCGLRQLCLSQRYQPDGTVAWELGLPVHSQTGMKES